MTGAVSFVVKIFTEASASVALMVVTTLPSPFSPTTPHVTCYCLQVTLGVGVPLLIN